MASSSKTVRKARIKAADVLQRVLESSSESFSESSEDSLSDSDVGHWAGSDKLSVSSTGRKTDSAATDYKWMALTTAAVGKTNTGESNVYS